MSSDNQVERETRAAYLRDLQAEVNASTVAYETAVTARDEALRRFHGASTRGGLSYREMAAATGLSRSRVIQIVQGESEYSKHLQEGTS